MRKKKIKKKYKKKLVFVINYFYPDLASTGQLMTDLCFALQEEYDITVIAAQPGYAGEKLSSSKRFEKDYFKKVKIIRISLPSLNKTSKFSRLKYIFFYFLFANIAMLREKNIDLIYTISQPPILGGLIGTIGKFIKGTKHIYNVQDFNPEQAEAISYTKSKFIYKIAKKIDNLNCKYADNVVIVGNDMIETLRKRFNNKKVPNYTVINNWTDETDITPLSKKEPNVDKFLKQNGLENKFIVMYSGNIGLFYDLENIIKVTKCLEKCYDIAFVFIGEGAVKKQLQSYVYKEDLMNVHFLPYQPKEFLKYSLNAADLHLVVNQKGIKGISVPSKVYGVMAAGKPILGVLEQGSEAQKLIDESKCGIVVEPQNYKSIMEAIELFYKMNREDLVSMGMRGRKYLEKRLKREISINKYKNVLERVLSN